VHRVETEVEVTGLEVVRLAGDLLACHVKQVGVVDGDLFDGLFQSGRLAVIENNDSESVGRVVLVERTTSGVKNDLIIFTTAGDKDIHRWAVISSQTQPGPATLLQRHHSPTVVHERRNCDGDLDCDEDPSTGIVNAGEILCRNDTVDTQTQVKQIYTHVGEGEKRGECEEHALPALPDLRIVAITDASDRSRLDQFLGEFRRERIDELCQRLVALADLRIMTCVRKRVDEKK